MKLHPEAQIAVVAGFAEFVEAVDLSRYETLKPNAGRVIIKAFEDTPEDHTAGGIITGDKADKQEIGIVVAVGNDPFNPYDGAVNYPVNYHIGDVVLFPEHFGHNFTYGGDREQLLSMVYTDLIAKL